MPGFSVVIPAYNSANYIDETIRSVLHQTVSADEVIVVDDCSTDDTVARVRQYGNAVTLIPLTRNTGGASIPRNVGIEAARSEWIVPFDADDLMLPTKLERQAALVRALPDVSAGFSDFQLFGKLCPPCSHCTTYGHFKNHLVPVREDFYALPHPHALDSMMYENYVGAGALVVKKSAWKAVGGYDEKMQSAEDMDFVMRLAEHFSFGYVDEVLHRYRVRGDSKSSNKIRCYSHALRTLRRYMSWCLSAENEGALKKQIQNYESDLAYYESLRGNIRATINHIWQATRLGAPHDKYVWYFPKVIAKALIRRLSTTPCPT